jgi:glucose/arabinose dehydrogenase
MRFLLACSLALAALAVPAGARADNLTAGNLALTPVGGSFSVPVFATAPPGDSTRLFVVQQNGDIKLVKGTQQSDFMTVPGVQYVANGEQGLLSMAFAPDYASSHRFYVYYTDAGACSGGNCDIRMDEFTWLDADHGDASTRRQVLSIPHQNASNHNGGQLQFGPDGYLYLATGDGGGGGDPGCNGQRLDSLLGKVLRIDPRQSGGQPYTVPAGNPFSTATAPYNAIWSYGLRNPWRFSFDRATGDLTIGDVGQGLHEEVDFHRLADGAGRGVNFGWNVFEGNAPFSTACASPPLASYLPPALTYDHVMSGGYAVAGGYVVRDPGVPALAGRYLYADTYRGPIRSAVLTPCGAMDDSSTGLQVGFVVSFGEDAAGQVYVVSLNGGVYQLMQTSPGSAPATSPCPSPPTGGAAQTGGGTTTTTTTSPVATPDRVRPVISAVSLKRSRFAVGAGSTAVNATARGTTFRYTLSEAATVGIRIERQLAGRRVGRRCRAPSASNRSRPRCTRLALAGTLRRAGRQGSNSAAFTGRIGRGALLPGRYRATLAATDGAGNVSSGRSVEFTVVAR